MLTETDSECLQGAPELGILIISACNEEKLINSPEDYLKKNKL